MKFRGVLLKPLAAQMDRDMRLIDPRGVKFDPDEVYVVTREFSQEMPAAGWGRISKQDDGTLVVEGELSAYATDPWQLAIGITVSRIEHEVEAVRNVVTDCTVFGIAVTNRHADESQPWIELEGT